AQGRVGSLGLSTSEVEMIAGNTYTVDFTATQAAQLAGFQGTLKLAEGVDFVGLEYGAAQAGNFNTTFANRGLITMSYNVSGTELADDELVFSLIVRANADVRLSDAVNINSEYTAAEAYTNNNQIRNFSIDFVGVDTEAAAFELLQNTPNPVADVTTIGFNLPVAAEVNLTVQDVNGKVVLNRSLEGFAGYNSTNITVEELGANGIFTYTVVAGDFTATKKMVVVR
ncbi:MAG: T9SS type A sorting domain-containing protein, partial [Bacteroidota bacterium]